MPEVDTYGISLEVLRNHLHFTEVSQATSLTISQVNTLCGIIHNYELKIHNLEVSESSLKDLLETVTIERDEFLNENESLTDELKGKNALIKQMRIDHREEIEDLQRKYDIVNLSLNKLEKKMIEEQIEAELSKHLQIKLTESNKNLDEKDKNLKELLSKYDEIEGKLALSEGLLKKSNKRNKELRREVEKLKKRLIHFEKLNINNINKSKKSIKNNSNILKHIASSNNLKHISSSNNLKDISSSNNLKHIHSSNNLKTKENENIFNNFNQSNTVQDNSFVEDIYSSDELDSYTTPDNDSIEESNFEEIIDVVEETNDSVPHKNDTRFYDILSSKNQVEERLSKYNLFINNKMEDDQNSQDDDTQITEEEKIISELAPLFPNNILLPDSITFIDFSNFDQVALLDFSNDSLSYMKESEDIDKYIRINETTVDPSVRHSLGITPYKSTEAIVDSLNKNIARDERTATFKAQHRMNKLRQISERKKRIREYNHV